MIEPCVVQLPYPEDSAELFDRISAEPWSVFLDSGQPKSHFGFSRYDIMSAFPWATITSHGPITRIEQNGHLVETRADPFEVLRGLIPHSHYRFPNLPFLGGAIGYFGYDLCRRIENLPSLAIDAEQIPDMAIGIYDWAVVIDHETRSAKAILHGQDPGTVNRWPHILEKLHSPASSRINPFRTTSAVASNMDSESYASAFRKIKHYIHEGDCYQVNLAQRFCARAEGDGFDAYRKLRSLNTAPFCAYLHLPQLEVLSSSPERLLKVRDRQVETKPIKGTRPRSPNPVLDEDSARILAESQKDRAENLMIVDLLRNDLNKNCLPGSVKVPLLFGIESFVNVHHLVSTVTGTLASGKDALHLLRGCFPGGSITGAPKHRAMQIIEELEPHRRGVYCGAIGYIDYNGDMDTSIAIRTLTYSRGVIRCFAGGGIVSDSTLEEEYQETLIKARAMLTLLSESGSGNGIHPPS
ncbi:MAG TPA: aminodeoxychorismate synthase component I [Burkholderiales bacterium]|nr:aminodeoxychorismate synthase component I [Burkholderiales bacterium]